MLNPSAPVLHRDRNKPDCQPIDWWNSLWLRTVQINVSGLTRGWNLSNIQNLYPRHLPYSDACYSAYGLTHLGKSNIITGPLRFLGGYVLMGGLNVPVWCFPTENPLLCILAHILPQVYLYKGEGGEKYILIWILHYYKIAWPALISGLVGASVSHTDISLYHER